MQGIQRSRSHSKTNRESEHWLILLAGILLLGAPRLSAQAVPSPEAPAADKPAEVERRIAVSVPNHKLAFLEHGSVVKIYSVGVGSRLTPSPQGTFRVVNRVKNPTYYCPGVEIPPGKENPVGTRWIGLSAAGYGIHGTDEPRTIARATSHGCIRMRNRDAEDLFARVRVGDVVEVHYQADAETLALFHDDQPVKSATETVAVVAGGTN